MHDYRLISTNSELEIDFIEIALEKSRKFLEFGSGIRT